MFNEANKDKRLRFAIRGRVIVFTTSTLIEYLTEDFTRSTPLFLLSGFLEQNMGYVFTVEFQDGHLTFEEGSYVKIVELEDFNRTYYNPNSWAIVKVSDPFIPFIVTIQPVYPQAGLSYTCEVTVALENGSATFEMTPTDHSGKYYSDWDRTFKRESEWKGVNGYPGYKQAAI